MSVPSRWSLHGDLTWRALWGAVRAVPWFLESPLIAGWSVIVLLLAGPQRRAILFNLKRILPDAPLWRRVYLTWRTFYHFGCATTDGIRFQQGEEVIAWEIEGLEHYEAAAASGKPVMLCTAHMGSYDAAAAFFAGRMGRRFSTVRLPERHPYLQQLREEALRRLENGAYRVLYNSSESLLAVDLLKVLQNREWLALQADRALPGLTAFTLESEGRPWRLPRGPFLLAAATNALCLPAFCRRVGPRRYQVRFYPAFSSADQPENPDTPPPGRARSREAAVEFLATRWAGLLLEVLQEDPAQWLVFEEAFESKPEFPPARPVPADFKSPISNFKSTAPVTPLFRLLFASEPAGPAFVPARVPGQNALEIRTLAGFSFLLFLAAALDLTSALTGWLWLLRAPLILLLCFALPQFLFALIAVLFKPRGPMPSLRQSWVFLTTLTLFAAARVFDGGFGAIASVAWLILALANAAAFLLTSWRDGKSINHQPWTINSQPSTLNPPRAVTVLLILAHAVPIAVGFTSGFWSGFACMAGLHALLLAGTFCVRGTPFCPAARRVPVSDGEKTVLLTIDDGPCEDTRAMLDILDAFQAKAVFFLIGERAAARPDDVREILRRGHAIANHTHTHPATTFWAYPPNRQRREIQSCQEILTSIGGSASGGVLPWFRAPAGFRNPWTGAVLRELNLKYLGWHARGFDATDTDIPRVLRRLTKNLLPGAVLLIHQGKPHHPELLRRLLTELRDNGWRALSPSTLPEIRE